MVTTYLTSVLLPSLGTTVTTRNEMELRVLASAVDVWLKGEVAHAADMLIQQFKAVENAQTEGSWRLARHLQAAPASRVTSLPDGERDRLLRAEEKELRRQALSAKLVGGGRPPRNPGG